MSDMILEKRSVEKALLAKLLARENIRVEIRRAHTAYFDLGTRILVVPKMKDNVSDAVYVSYIGHEVGHALYTNKEEWIAVQKEQKVPNCICQVVEDVRIESRIKQIYPGMKSIFFKSYTELFKNGFFGVKSLKEANKLGFLDRFNTYFKMGKAFGIKFSKQEKPFIEKGHQLHSWQDAEKLMVELRDYLLLNPDNKFDNEFGDEEEIVIGNDGNGCVPGIPKDDDQSGGTGYIEGKPPTSDDADDNEDNDDENEDEIDSETLKALEEAKKELIDFLADEVINVYAVSNDWKQRIVGYNKIFRYTEEKFLKLEILKRYQKFAIPYVDHMVQIFNLRKNELQFRKLSYNKTGNLDLDRIHEYQMVDDLFIRDTVEPKGQSHGLVIFFDWSTSMKANLKYSLYQLFFLTDFCRKLNIPFETYTFTSGGSTNNDKKYPGSLCEYTYRLVNILSSKMNGKEYNKMQQILLDEDTYGSREYFGMSGTPLNETIMAAMEIVPQFKQQHQLDNVNICFVTDGEGHSIFEYNDETGDGTLSFSLCENIYLHDLKTHHVEKILTEENNLTEILLRMLEVRTKSNVIGFRLCVPTELTYGKLATYAAQLKDEKTVTVEKMAGYTNYHLIDLSLININSDARIIDRRLKFVLKEFIKLIT